MAESSVGNVVEMVSQQAKGEVLSVLSEAVKDAESLLETARREAAENVSKILESRDRQEESVKRRIIGNAELTARNRSLQVTEETVNMIFRDSLQEISRLHPAGSYEYALKKILEEGVVALGVKELVCSCNERDLKIIKKHSGELSKRLKVKIEVASEHIKCAGGVRVSSADGSIVYDNTVEARLERIKPLLRRQVYDLLTRSG